MKSYYVSTKRNKIISKAYGITVGDFDQMLEAQGGTCAVCKTGTPGGNGRFHIDHDHETGKNRGLLCHLCNVSLGGFKDSVALLLSAVDYLRFHGK